MQLFVLLQAHGLGDRQPAVRNKQATLKPDPGSVSILRLEWLRRRMPGQKDMHLRDKLDRHDPLLVSEPPRRLHHSGEGCPTHACVLSVLVSPLSNGWVGERMHGEKRDRKWRQEEGARSCERESGGNRAQARKHQLSPFTTGHFTPMHAHSCTADTGGRQHAARMAADAPPE